MLQPDDNQNPSTHEPQPMMRRAASWVPRDVAKAHMEAIASGGSVPELAPYYQPTTMGTPNSVFSTPGFPNSGVSPSNASCVVPLPLALPTPGSPPHASAAHSTPSLSTPAAPNATLATPLNPMTTPSALPPVPDSAAAPISPPHLPALPITPDDPDACAIESVESFGYESPSIPIPTQPPPAVAPSNYPLPFSPVHFGNPIITVAAPDAMAQTPTGPQAPAVITVGVTESKCCSVS